MAAAIPALVRIGIDQLEEGFVDERGRLKVMPRLFQGQPLRGKPPQPP